MFSIEIEFIVLTWGDMEVIKMIENGIQVGILYLSRSVAKSEKI